MARVSKMNMIMHGDGHGGIFHLHGLDVGFTAAPALRPSNDVTCIFSNPPFAGREQDPLQLDKFLTTHNESGRALSTPKSIPFLEHILNLLTLQGRAALVLPNGIFNSQSYQFRKVRELLWQKAEIIAIIGLPHWVFFHTGCDVQGALLFLKRTDTPRADYNVFIDWAENVGYDAAGRKTGRNDFHDILERFNRRNPPNLFKASFLRAKGRIDPPYYQPGEHQKISHIRGKNVPLTDILIPGTEIIRRTKDSNVKVRYVEVGDTDMATGRILKTGTYEISKLPSRAKYIVRENMLLIPNHRNSIKAGRSVVLVTPEDDGIVVTSRFIVARSTVPSLYLYHLLNLDFVKQKMLTLVSGSSSTEVKFEQLREIFVPLPEEDDFELFLERLRDLQEQVDDARNELEKRRSDLDKMVRELY